MKKQDYKFLVMGITMIRIPLILLFSLLAVLALLRDVPSLNVLAFVMIILSAATDLIDGYLARKWDVCTRIGAYADPLADKVFYLASLPTLMFLALYKGQATHGIVLLVLTILFLLRDQWVSFLRSIGSEYKADVRANWSGKLRTAMSFPIIFAVFACLAWFPSIPMVFVYTIEAAGILINLVSVWIYTRDYSPYLRKAINTPDS